MERNDYSRTDTSEIHFLYYFYRLVVFYMFLKDVENIFSVQVYKFMLNSYKNYIKNV